MMAQWSEDKTHYRTLTIRTLLYIVYNLRTSQRYIIQGTLERRHSYMDGMRVIQLSGHVTRMSTEFLWLVIIVWILRCTR